MCKTYLLCFRRNFVHSGFKKIGCLYFLRNKFANRWSGYLTPHGRQKREETFLYKGII